jgi:Domain of unknown function (DUF4424)
MNKGAVGIRRRPFLLGAPKAVSAEGENAMRKRLAALILAALCSSASANDSTATVGAGGLVLEKTDSIAMESEDLYVSVDEVRVRYRFRNLSAAPVSTVVAFPMPPRSLATEYGGDVAYPSNFRTSVDGRPVTAKLERKATINGRDHRALLERFGVPVAPESINEATAAMDRLPPARQAELVRLGLAGQEEYDAGKGMEKHLIPLWTVEDRYWWTQAFPARRDVQIDHRYVPGAGGSVDTFVAFPEYRKTAESRAMAAKYCVDKATIATVDKRRNKGLEGPMMPQRNVDYILTTGANWAKPIGDFRLVVDKGNPKNLVSFCGEGVRKISPTRFEMRKRNWRPTHDLHVLIIEPRR